ncbi:endonuclease VIII-like 3 [Vigna unguiculata]|uniref:Endonuclease VIII-like 3 n=1 Tax=Vigna unguiculata TaxID=3917 RepID=A0A4D6M981_VIGUN|nr:endonuclease VIII-like 3 [Vigna unguiculata]
MSFSHSPSKSQTQNSQSPTVIPLTCPPHLVKRMQQEICFICDQLGHWSWYCPFKSPNSKHVSPSANQASPVSSNAVQCSCGHGACEIKTSRSGRNFYTCPIKSGVKCKDFVKWCDEPVAESDFQPPIIKYPECACKAGVCRRVKDKDTDGVFKYYFTCPVKQGHGSCGYRVWEDEIKVVDGKTIVPTQRSRQRSLHEFWEGCQNDETDDELGSELSKRMKVTDYSEDPLAVPDIPALTVANSNRNGFPDFMADDDEFEFISPVSWETVEEEAFLSLSQLSTPSRIRWRQIMFQMRISSDASFGSCRMGWLGRLLFFHPAQSLNLPTPKPFFCCIFPSFNPIIVPKQRNVSDAPCNKLAIKGLGHTEVSGHVVKSQDGERKSKASRHREVILFTQQQLLADLETLAPHEHESMKEAAETTFAILNVLQVDCKKFSDHVLDYINFASSIAEIDKSKENFLTMEDLNKLFEEEKMGLAQLQDDHVKTKALLEASKRHRQLLCEQVSHLEAMLNEKQNQLKFCELETLKIETRLVDLERNILVTDITLKERAEQTKVAKKQSEERQTKQIAAHEALQKAKLELENW